MVQLGTGNLLYRPFTICTPQRANVESDVTAKLEIAEMLEDIPL